MDIDDEKDDLDIATKSWKRVINTAQKTGYREGAQDGSASVIQEGFDIGYKESFKTAFLLGKYQGLATALPQDVQHPAHIKAILDNTKLGNCYMCSKEFQSTNSLSEVICNQKRHSEIALETLHKYLKPLLKELQIDISHMKDEFYN